MDECWQLLREMRSVAAPGPDGFNATFYKNAWPWIKWDVQSFVKHFYETGELNSAINKTEIVLIPKLKTCTKVTDYRPISLSNLKYRLLAKPLANRIKPHLPDYIHHTQHDFIEGRHISDNVIIAQEIVHSFHLKSFKQKAFMLSF